MINIDVYSDLSCPWCYVGKARLDKAIQKFKDASITVNWHPYIIDKNTATLGEDYMAYNTRRWGGDGWTRSLRKAGQQDGLEFKNWKTWPNSLHGHRLIHLAGIQKGPEGQGKAKDLLFRMIYEDGKNVSDVDTLIEAAKELGLEGAEDYLKSSSNVDLVLSEDSRAKSQMKISGVPYFVISSDNKQNETVSLSGAQGTERFLAAFSHVMQ